MGILGRIILLVCDISPRHGSVNADQEDIIISVKKFGDVFIFSYLCRMNKKEKLIKRFRTLPRDFTFDEVVTLFQGCGFTLENKGSTSGSRVKFYNESDQNAYIMHKPHPSNIIKGYMMRDILNYLLKNNYIK